MASQVLLNLLDQLRQSPRSAPLAFKGIRYIRVDSHTVKLADLPEAVAPPD